MIPPKSDAEPYAMPSRPRLPEPQASRAWAARLLPAGCFP